MKKLSTLLITSLIVWSCGLVFSPALWANPSASNPRALLRARSEETSQRYWKRANDATQLVYELGIPINQKFRSGDLNSINPAEVGEIYSALHEIQYCSEQLARLGEPVHTQLDTIRLYYYALLNEVITEYRKLPGVAQSVGQSFEKKSSKATKTIIKESRKLKKVQGMAKKGEWEELSEAVHEAELEVLKYLCWLPGVPIGKSRVAPVLAVRSQYREEISDFFNERADNILTQLRDAETPQLKALTSKLSAAADSISKSGQVESGSESLSGPDWLLKFTSEWETALAQINRVRGIEASHWQTNPQSEMTMKALQSNQENFFNEIIQGVAKLIEADASQISEDLVRERHFAYLQSLGQLLTYRGEFAAEGPIDLALDHLAQKSPTFGDDVRTYKTVTDDMLRWRKRKTDARVNYLKAEYTPLAEAAGGKAGIGRGKLHERDDEELDNKVTIVDEIEKAKTELLEKMVIADDCLFVNNQGKLYTSIEKSIAAEIPALTAHPSLVNNLEKDLLIKETRSLYPLSLKAAQAIYHIYRGDFYQVGGKIVDFELRGRVTLLAECTPGDLARETISSMQEAAKLNASLLMGSRIFVCQIEPAFIRNEHFILVFE